MTPKTTIVIFVLILLTASLLWADDLYRVPISNQKEADILASLPAQPILRESGAYLIIADRETADALYSSGLKLEKKASNISIDNLAYSLSPTPRKEYPIAYRQNDFILYQVDASAFALSKDAWPEYYPVIGHQPKVFYKPSKEFNPNFALAEIDLNTLIAMIVQDSLESYDTRLQAFNGRVTGTDSCHAARDWIAAKYASFGYDSVVIDSFIWGGSSPGQNVVAYKVGSRYPNKYIVIGGHYDAVPGSPGADDNGSGTSGTLEIARVLANIETEMTFVFIAFDAEETGLNGSKHYADEAAARGDDIVYMLNMDMIANIGNDAMAKLYYGDDIAYSQLWGKLADSLVGVTGILSGIANNSDHASFAQDGYDVTFVHEYVLSSVYHSSQDSTAYMDFSYMTKLVKASLATAYTVDNSPPPVTITSIADGGDGQSLRIYWQIEDITNIDSLRLYFTTVPPTQPDSVLLSVDSTAYTVTGLVEGTEYSFYIVAYGSNGHSSIAVNKMTATPQSIPPPPAGFLVLPIRDSIKLSWRHNNTELDFHHYGIIRDNALLSLEITDTVYIDGDPALGTDIHTYRVVAFDADGNMSDTAGIAPISMKAAALERTRILAINRSSDVDNNYVDEAITGDFLRDALSGLYFDYKSDTSSSNPQRTSLMDLLDYGIVIVGAESGRGADDIGDVTSNILGDLTYYLSIGGKLIIFGRWGNIQVNPGLDTVYYQPTNYNGAYFSYFNTAFRLLPISYLQTPGPVIVSDFIGAHSQKTGYPELTWDSTATMSHTGTAFTGVTGIPCPSLPFVTGPGSFSILYTYNSSVDSPLTENKPIAWEHIDTDYEYVYFDIPLSFIQRDSAIAALHRAINDLGLSTAVTDNDDNTTLPIAFVLHQNYPNPFNPTTTIEFYNPGNQPADVRVEVFNILGQKVKTIFDDKALPGLNTVEWDGKNESGQSVASGVYFYRLKAHSFSQTKKMILIK